ERARRAAAQAAACWSAGARGPSLVISSANPSADHPALLAVRKTLANDLRVSGHDPPAQRLHSLGSGATAMLVFGTDRAGSGLGFGVHTNRGGARQGAMVLPRLADA